MESIRPNFPLQLWEQTEDYQAKLAKARHEFGQAFSRLYREPVRDYGGEVVFTVNEIPAIFVNMGSFHGQNVDLDSALDLAKEGSYGYFTARNIQELARGRGVIFDEAMWQMGFRRHKRNPEKWARKTKADRDKDGPYAAYGEELFSTVFETPSPDEQARLRLMCEAENSPTRLGESYSLAVGRTGMLQVSLDVNPMAGQSAQTIGELGRQLVQKGHISPIQEGFNLVAQNVRIFDKPLREGEPLSHDAIYLQAVRADGKALETVWPETATGSGFISLTVGLRERVHEFLQPAPMQTSFLSL